MSPAPPMGHQPRSHVHPEHGTEDYVFVILRIYEGRSISHVTMVNILCKLHCSVICKEAFRVLY